MPPYRQRNPSGIFQIFAQDNKDRMSLTMQTIGKISFSIAVIASACGGAFNKTVTDHKVLEIIVGGAAAGGYFLGIFMFIGVGARTSGQENGINGFAGQLFRLIWKTFLYFLLPVLLLTGILILFVKPQ